MTRPVLTALSFALLVSACASGTYPVTGCDADSNYPVSCEHIEKGDAVQSAPPMHSASHL